MSTLHAIPEVKSYMGGTSQGKDNAHHKAKKYYQILRNNMITKDSLILFQFVFCVHQLSSVFSSVFHQIEFRTFLLTVFLLFTCFFLSLFLSFSHYFISFFSLVDSLVALFSYFLSYFILSSFYLFITRTPGFMVRSSDPTNTPINCLSRVK